MGKPLRTLVLNGDGRPLTAWPLSLIDPRDAVSAIWRDRVTVLETWPGAAYRSPSCSIEVPKVVMLREYKAVIGKKPKFCRRSVLLRDRSTCQFCGERFPSEELTYDHVVPRSRGGKTTWDNIVCACIRCNADKGDRTCKEARMYPIAAPHQPTNFELLRAGLEFLPNDVREDFASWLYWSAELRA